MLHSLGRKVPSVLRQVPEDQSSVPRREARQGDGRQSMTWKQDANVARKRALLRADGLPEKARRFG
jgi:hypothetical protein